MIKKLQTAAAIITLCLVTSTASATTITFTGATGNPNDTDILNGFTFNPSNAVGGNCPVPVAAEKPCLAEVKQGEITTMERVGGGSFDLLGVDFLLVGSGNNDGSFLITAGSTVLEIMFGDLLGSFATYALTHVDGTDTGSVTFNEGYRLTFAGLFDDITSVSFSTTTTAKKGDAQARMDNVVVSVPSAVPLPAAGWLMLAGLGGIAALRRRKTA